MRKCLTVLVMGLLAAAPAGAASRAEAFVADYSVSVVGVPVAKARFESRFTAKSFKITGSMRSFGLVRLFERVDGTTTLRGTMSPDGAVPKSFVVDYRSGKDQQATHITYSKGAVSGTTNLPKPKTGGKNWVRLHEKHLRGAVDPLTATLVRATTPAQVCDRTLRLFDGAMRADLELTHESTGRHDGFEGEAVTCRAAFKPVAGYRKGRDQIEFLERDSKMRVTFVKLGDTGFYTPVDATIGTEIGPVRIMATRLERLG